MDNNINAEKINVGDITAVPFAEQFNKGTVIKFRPDDYGGIEAVELNYSSDDVYIRGVLADDYEGIEDFLKYNRKKLYNSVIGCALAMERKK